MKVGWDWNLIQQTLNKAGCPLSCVWGSSNELKALEKRLTSPRGEGISASGQLLDSSHMSGFPWVPSPPACPAEFGLASPHKHARQLLK